MSVQILKFSGLLVLTVIVLVIAWQFGPLAQLPQIVRIDENYLTVARNHELFVGAVAFSVVLLVNTWVGASIALALLAAVIGGMLFFAFGQFGDPDFLSKLANGLLEFLSRYLLSGGLVTFIYVAMTKFIHANT